jgi:hypothetical protein
MISGKGQNGHARSNLTAAHRQNPCCPSGLWGAKRVPGKYTGGMCIGKLIRKNPRLIQNRNPVGSG